MEASFEQVKSELVERVKPQLDEAKRQLDSLNERVTQAIKDHPAACLFGALAAGYLVARIARQERS